MKILLSFVVVIFLGGVGFCQHSNHVILISIDGFRPAFYLDTAWPAPNLQRLKSIGAYSPGMRSVFPSYTYPAHVAMVTGALPARSGIYYNAPRGSKGEWNWYAKDIKVPTIWEYLSRAGMRTSAVQWPVSVGASITYNIPEIWDTKHPSDRITVSRKFSTKGLVEEVEAAATGRLDSISMNEESLSLDANSARIASFVLRTYKPNLLAVHFAGIDGRQHEHGLKHEAVKIAVSSVDNAVGVILEGVRQAGIEETTTILVVGDHGFSDMHTVIKPNIWLKRKGISSTFQASGGSAFLYGGSEFDVSRVIAATPDSVRGMFTVIDKEELTRKGVDSAALVAFSAKPGYVFSGSSEGTILTPLTGGHHGYDPAFPEMQTGFLAIGTGVKSGYVIDDMSVQDICPLIGRLLGIEVRYIDGKLHQQLFDFQSSKKK